MPPLWSSSSTLDRFLRIAADFGCTEGYRLEYTVEAELVCLRLEGACEFVSRKDDLDNWESEMDARFCLWSLRDWKEALSEAGFECWRSADCRAEFV